jgi:F-type H+-transporting ATPase subunit a
VRIFAVEDNGGFHFPSLDELVEWPAFLFEGTPFAINKIVLVIWLSALITLALFYIAGRQGNLVPKGVQNLVESMVDFVKDGIIMQTMGPSGMYWLPFLTTLFFFIFFMNIFEVIPPIIMPATARMAIPLFLAMLVFVIFIAVGIKYQGLGGYLKSTLFPPGVPAALYILVTPIELVSVFLVRPFSLAVRLFANLLAGHILVATFAVLTAALVGPNLLLIAAPLPFVMLVFVLLFEVLVSVLQAYIFTILAAVYIGGSMHPEH